jgi:hypothetical protein
MFRSKTSRPRPRISTRKRSTGEAEGYEIERLRQHRETSHALSQALSEIERLRSHADQHRETSNALRDALAEIERLRSDAADLHRTKFDLGLSNLPPASIAADWFLKFSERKQALIGEKVRGRKSDTE